jgi:ABC-type sugar transport system ATPase subunit
MIQVRNLTIRAGEFSLVDVSFHVGDNEYAVLMGKTGCGKTSLLEAVCGLKPIECGSISLSGRDVSSLKPAERGIGYVPQDLALFPAMTVKDHLAFALRIRKWSTIEIASRVEELAELLGISDLLLRLPHGLSGGERQRVALGRALSFRPAVLCLDEPLSALDDETKQQMYTLLKRAQQHEHVTALHVTHSQSEANRLADRIFRVDCGEVIDLNAASQGSES